MKYVEHIVRVSKAHDGSFSLDDEGELDYSRQWTYANALLFTMTTLTLIGNTFMIMFH